MPGGRAGRPLRASGAPLARLEGLIALRLLLERVTRVELVDAEPAHFARLGGPEHLRVRFER